MANTTYHRIIRKLVIGFGNLFKDITLVRYTSNTSETERFIVPIVYATKENYIQRLEADPALDKKVQITLPIMSFEMVGLNYDSARKQNTNFKSFAKTDTGVIAQYNPVPYNFDFNLYLYVRNIEDGTQIIEHILPYFTPDYTIKLNLIPEMGIVKEVPIILNSTINEIEYEGPGRSQETRLIIWTLNFTVKGFIFGKTSAAELIQTSITNILTNVNNNRAVVLNLTNDGFGIYKIGEMVYQGYSPNTATATGRILDVVNNKLHLTEMSGNFVSNQNIVGMESNASYNFDSYELVDDIKSQVIVTPSPTDANVDSIYTHTTTIRTGTEINSNVIASQSIAGDLMEHPQGEESFGMDDLYVQQEKQTDLGS
jgi:hypothetical protein